VTGFSSPDRGPRPGELIAKTNIAGDRCVVLLAGEIDLASAPVFERELRSAEAKGARQVVVDLGGVEFMDSSGIRALLEARRRAEEAGHRLVLRHCRRQIWRLFEITGITDLFSFDED